MEDDRKLKYKNSDNYFDNYCGLLQILQVTQGP